MSGPARRRVYYLSGFDPRGPARYHRLYGEESAKQSRLNASTVYTGPRVRLAPFVHAWTIEARWPDGDAITSYRFLAWDDLIRKAWVKSEMACLGRYARDFLRAVFDGHLLRLPKLGKAALYAALAPALILLVPAMLAALGAVLSGLAGAMAALVLGTGAMWWLARRLNLVWLLNIYRFCLDYGRDPHREIETRLDAFAKFIVSEERMEPAGETILVAHSVGAILAIPLMERLARLGCEPKLVTLGGCLPIIGQLPEADGFRSSLRHVLSLDRLLWKDYASISDVLSFARIDPLEACGASQPWQAKHSRHLIKFVHMFAPEAYRRLKRDKLRIHFQYIMAAERETGYDYFRLTAGPNENEGLPSEPLA